MGRLYQIILVGPKCHHKYLYKGESGGDNLLREKAMRRWTQKTFEDWNNMATRQGELAPPIIGRGKEWILLQSLWKERSPVDTSIFGPVKLISDFWPENKCLLLNQQVCGNLLQQPWEIKTTPLLQTFKSLKKINKEKLYNFTPINLTNRLNVQFPMKVKTNNIQEEI